MKIFPILGVASLAANVALLGVIAAGSFTAKPEPARTVTIATKASTPQPATAAASEAWTELSATDLAAERDRLQSEGFPPAMIRAILAAQIREQFAARRKAIDAAAANQPYWKNPIPDPQTQALSRALAKEEQKALKELLGPDPVNSYAARLRREFPELPAEKVDSIAAIRERYDELRQEIYGTGFRGGSTSPVERDKINSLEKAMQGEFATVLSPEELENYNLRTSSTANSLRYTLSNFDPTEAEFRALYRLQSAFDDQHRFVGGSMSQEQQRARSDAQKKLNDAIAASLGTARYADYQRTSDYNFRQTSQLVSRLNLPPETATTLYAVQKDIEDRRNAIYRDTTPETRSQMTQKVTALAEEATARINTILGGNKTATDAYKQYGGQWLNGMIPRPAVTTPAPTTPAPAR